MILYSNAYIRMLESNGQWFTCIEYLHNRWKMNKEDISLFLKIAVNTWYTLTLDGPELSLKKEESDALNQMLQKSYSFFRASFSNDENCQWLFGYMMTVRTDLFLLTAAVVSQRRCLSVDNILFHQVTTRKVTVPEGDDPSGYITEPNRDRAVLSAKPVL